MPESPCAHCGYDLSATAFVGDERVCPECGGANRYLTIAAPWWIRHPLRFDFAMVWIGAPWAVVAVALSWTHLGDNSAAARNVIVATIALAVASGIGWIAWLHRDVRKRLGRTFVSGWSLAWHALVALIGIPVMWMVTVVGLNAARAFLWQGR